MPAMQSTALVHGDSRPTRPEEHESQEGEDHQNTHRGAASEAAKDWPGSCRDAEENAVAQTFKRLLE
jgi:hypothetical protein